MKTPVPPPVPWNPPILIETLALRAVLTIIAEQGGKTPAHDGAWCAKLAEAALHKPNETPADPASAEPSDLLG